MSIPQMTIDLITALNRSLELIQMHKASVSIDNEIDAYYASAGISVVMAIQAIATQFAMEKVE